MELRPTRGGFARPFGAGWFIREYLRGNGPEGSTRIDPERGAPQSDINYEYKVSLATLLFTFGCWGWVMSGRIALNASRGLLCAKKSLSGLRLRLSVTGLV